MKTFFRGLLVGMVVMNVYATFILTSIFFAENKASFSTIAAFDMIYQGIESEIIKAKLLEKSKNNN